MNNNNNNNNNNNVTVAHIMALHDVLRVFVELDSQVALDCMLPAVLDAVRTLLPLTNAVGGDGRPMLYLNTRNTILRAVEKIDVIEQQRQQRQQQQMQDEELQQMQVQVQQDVPFQQAHEDELTFSLLPDCNLNDDERSLHAGALPEEQMLEGLPPLPSGGDVTTPPPVQSTLWHGSKIDAPPSHYVPPKPRTLPAASKRIDFV